jgi:hypothetical protein
MDKIDEFISRLSSAQLRDVAARIKSRLSRRGRPSGAKSKTPRTRASVLGAQYVRRLRNKYMKERGVKRVPALFTETAFDRAKAKYPDAKKSIMREHLRKQGQYRVRLRS